jgi:hypothetical protein
MKTKTKLKKTAKKPKAKKTSAVSKVKNIVSKPKKKAVAISDDELDEDFPGEMDMEMLEIIDDNFLDEDDY